MNGGGACDAIAAASCVRASAAAATRWIGRPGFAPKPQFLKAKTLTSPAERSKLYEQAQVIFKEQAPWFTIAHAVQLKPVRKEVIDFKLSPFGRHNFYGVDIKE